MSNADQGAVLVLDHCANHEAIHESRSLVKYLAQNMDSWVEFITTGLEIDIPRSPGLMFIGGFHKTVNWAVASYVAAGKAAEFHVNTDFLAASGAISASASSQTYIAPIQNWGPERIRTEDGNRTRDSNTRVDEEKYDQSIFLNYYRIKKRLGFPMVVKAAAGYDELPRYDRGSGEGLATPAAAHDSDDEEDLDVDISLAQVHVSPR